MLSLVNHVCHRFLLDRFQNSIKTLLKEEIGLDINSRTRKGIDSASSRLKVLKFLGIADVESEFLKHCQVNMQYFISKLILHDMC